MSNAPEAAAASRSTAAIAATSQPAKTQTPMAAAAWGAVLLLLVLLLFTAWQGPDIFYHLALGQKVLETGRPQPPEIVLATQPAYVNVYWLFQVVCAGIFGLAGPVGLTLFFAAAWVATFLLWISIAGLARRPALGLPLALAAVLVLQGRFDPRPEVISYLLLAIQLRWLLSWDFDRPVNVRRLALFGLVQAIWTNVHGFFVLGPFLVAAMLVSRALHPGNVAPGGERRAVRELAKLLAVTAVASLVSPFGPKGWAFVATLWRLGSKMPQSILELRPPTAAVFRHVWTIDVFYAVWIATALAVVWLLARRRFRAFPILTALPALALSATGVRYMPVLVLLGAPVWREIFRGASAQRTEQEPGPGPDRPRRPLATAAIAATGIVALALAGWAVTGGFYRSLQSPTSLGLGLRGSAYPVALAQHLRDAGFSGRIYNDSADGGFLAFRLGRAGVLPYIDSRYIEPPVVEEYFACLRDPRGFARLDARYRFDGAVLRVAESPELTATLLKRPEWKLEYADLHRAFFVKAERASAAGMTGAPSASIWNGEDLSE
ncbi:MAG: hypothetical protein QUU85_15725, partial [Candidatus Eisenbacteria bacterium]|nr:hypothetical protein [Candidatus Eisenbacteria bacterium]